MGTDKARKRHERFAWVNEKSVGSASRKRGSTQGKGKKEEPIAFML